MKRILVLIFCVPFFALAQNKPLLIEGAAPNWHLNHTVAAKENYYSLGRMYNISPKEIAPYNNLQLEKGLSLNQAIKIPLTAGNFAQENSAAADEVLVPVYHTVKEKEGLYRIATTYNKLPVETLKQWNSIKGDAVSNGTKLIVGYLKVKKELSPLSGMTQPVLVNTVPVAVKENVPAAKPVKETTKPDIVKEIPAVKKPDVKPVKEKSVPTVVKKEEKIEQVVAAPAMKDPAPVAVKEPAPEKPVALRSGKNFNGGFFKTDFDKQRKGSDAGNETGAAAVFKSTSGWEDGKYYCLHNTAAAGTIVKITNASTGKIIYAKVLDVMPDIKQNSGLLVRISNAAANELGAGENKFDCTVSFSK